MDEDLIPTPMKTRARISRKQTGESIPSLKRSANVRPHRNNRLPFAVYTEDLFKMATKSVQSLVEDFRLISETNYQIVEAVRALVKKKFKSATEEVK